LCRIHPTSKLAGILRLSSKSNSLYKGVFERITQDVSEPDKRITPGFSGDAFTLSGDGAGWYNNFS
jgi:hypothetical protein